MPRGQNRTAALPTHKGWWLDGINNRLVAVFNGAEIFDFDGNDIAIAQAVTFAVAPTIPASSVAGDWTLTGAGSDFISAAGNVQIGNPGAFATTQPQGAVVMGGSSLGGIAPAGAIATAGGVFASDTVVRKIIAAGTVSNVET